jgi:hypothetical protein
MIRFESRPKNTGYSSARRKTNRNNNRYYMFKEACALPLHFIAGNSVVELVVGKSGERTRRT